MKVYRLDKFVVPNGSREEFLAKVCEIREVLRGQPGFIKDFLLEQAAGDDAFNLVTLVEWEDETFVARAREAVMALHERTGFSPQETMSRLGIKAEMASYKDIVA